jgi:hypothetical protein
MPDLRMPRALCEQYRFDEVESLPRDTASRKSCQSERPNGCTEVSNRVRRGGSDMHREHAKESVIQNVVSLGCGFGESIV